MKSNQNTAWCNGCDGFIKNIPQGKPIQLYFGKYKGRLLSTMDDETEILYLKWVISQSWCKSLLKTQIEEHLKSVKLTDPNDDWNDYHGGQNDR
jgi:uncharacterized protein (DUF3820 family)